MPRNLSLGRRAATAAAWPVGVALTSWSYMWRTTPMHRTEIAGTLADNAPPALPSGIDAAELQRPEDGHGPLYNRRYRVRILDSQRSPEELVDEVRRHLNRAAPRSLATFHKVRGRKGDMRVGDEYVVRMPGPWDGPVRVVEVTADAFRFVTLASHLEAGQIRFSAHRAGRDVVFEIESWARSGDRVSGLLYQRLRMAKEVQLHMWTSFLERVVKRSGGRMAEGVEIRTWRIDDPGGGTPLLGGRQARRALDALHDQPLNFDPELAPRSARDGWFVDHLCQPLPGEAPGEPEPGGAWETARELMRAYEFADPSLIRAVYYPDRPLDGRDMLLEARFLGFRFRLGVRVGGVRDERVRVGGREARVWGWGYRTLEGHLEAGEMRYEVWKWLDTGDVEFRIDRHVRPARIPNPVVRLGFRVFGRRLQVRFAHRACERMAALTEAALASREPPLSRAGDAIRASGLAPANDRSDAAG